MTLRRTWVEARQKIDDEGQCRCCGQSTYLEAAHIIGRRADRYDLDGTVRRTKTYKVEPVRVVPLCGVHPDSRRGGCHPAFDAHGLNLLPYLRPSEIEQAILDAGYVGLSWRARLEPVESPSRAVA